MKISEQLQSSASRMPFIIVVLAIGARSGLAASPQVPALPAQNAGYVDYARTNLPLLFQAGPGVLDNTPVDNQMTDAGATLGRVLFYDKRLSHDNSTSCSSCHKQANGFSDANQFSTGINGQLTARHSPGLTNATFYENGRMFWDERASSLEDQALQPIQSPAEMGSTLPEVVTKLGQTTFYPTLFQAAFGTPEITADRIAKSIAQFERSMVSYNSKYDDYLNGQTTLTASEQRGETLFHGTGRCASCHTTIAQIGDEARNIGLNATLIDPGAGDGRFKTPSLRNVAVRGRFMHDGRHSSLQQVVQFYSTQVIDTPLLDSRLRDPLRLFLTTQQINDLVAFLNTLTDNDFLTSDMFSNPFVTLPGDYNGDGAVDTADYQVWRSSLGDTSSLLADGNEDGIVDTADYVMWRKNEGLTWDDLVPGGGAGIALGAVPEPSTLLLLLSTIPAYLYRRRRSPSR